MHIIIVFAHPDNFADMQRFSGVIEYVLGNIDFGRTFLWSCSALFFKALDDFKFVFCNLLLIL